MKVIKKQGYRQDYNINKIKIALERTAKTIDETFGVNDWKELKPRIESRLRPILSDRSEIYCREIDDIVIDALICSRFKNIAKEYIETRSRNVRDKLNDLHLTPIAMALLRSRYLRKDMSGEPIETVMEMMSRVATSVASVEKTQELREYYTECFMSMLMNLEFLPNSPCLVSAGTGKEGTWLACFAEDMEDSLVSIFDILKFAARVFQMGGGFGTTLSKLREKGALIHTSNGRSSGPIAFLRLFDAMIEVVKAGGFRRGAQMVIMDYNRPDIEEFISCKKNTDQLNNMNLSVLVKDDFFNKVREGKDIDLLTPVDESVIRQISARLLFEEIALNMWETGEPGILFYERINKDNPTPHLGDLHVTNPCAESTLLGYGEACDLGSVNLMKHLVDGQVDWEKLSKTISLAVRFLDNMLDGSLYPSSKMEENVKATRKIGLGIMGFADLLITLKVHYSSTEALKLANRIMSFINDVADQTSKELGKEKGIYPAYIKNYRKRRNSIVTTIAPTGSLSLIVGVSSGIEPNIAKIYSREIDGETFKIVHPMRDSEYFETAHDISPEQHIDMLIEFQKQTENSVSKTCNVPESTTVKQIKELILQARRKGAKGITIYRDNCSRIPLMKCEGESCQL